MNVADLPASGEPGPQALQSLRRVLILQTQNAFNDNVVRFALLGLALVTLGKPDAYKNILGILISLPFVLFAPLAGWLSDRFSKKNVLTACLVAQIVVIGIILLFLRIGNLTGATIGFFLLATQSAFLGPAKLGILKELVGSIKLVMASGWLQMLTITGIVFGSVVGGKGFERAYATALRDPWQAAFLPIAIVGVLAVIPLLLVRRVQATSPIAREEWRASILWHHWQDLTNVFRHRATRLSSSGIAYFWFAAAFLLVALTQLAMEIHPVESVAAVTSYYLVAMSFGIALGSVVIALLSAKGIELGLIPAGAAGLTVGLSLTGLLPPGSIGFYLALFLSGFTGAVYLVPLNAHLQDRADTSRRGRILSSSNLMNSLAAVLANVAQGGLEAAGLSAKWQLLLLAGATAVLAMVSMRLLPSNTLRVFLKTLIRLVYRVRVLGSEHIPREGGALLLSNHVTWIDALLIGSSSPREVRFVASKPYFDVPLVGGVMKIFNAIPIAPENPRQAIKATAEAVKEGSLVCIFPEGTLTRTGTLNELQKGFELIIRQSGGAPVVPVYLDRLWGSLLSFAGGRFFFKRPRCYPYPVTVSFGKTIPASDTRRDVVRNALLGLGARAYRFRPPLQRSLGFHGINALRHRPWATCLIVHARDRSRRVTRGAFLASALELAERWRIELPGKRIGIALPCGYKALLTQTALTLAGKTVVPLPLDAAEAKLSSAALRELLKNMEVDTVISSRDFRKRHAEFPWPRTVIDLDEALDEGIRWTTRMRARWLSKSRLRRRLGLDDALGIRARDEAIAVLTENDAGKPCYRFLSHQAVLTNIAQIADTNIFRKHERIANGYPLHQYAGQCFGLWLPLLERLEVVVANGDALGAHFGSLSEEEKVTSVIAGATRAPALLGLPMDTPGRRRFQFITFEPWRRDDVFRRLESRAALVVLHGWISPRWCQVVSMSMVKPDAPMPQGGHKAGASGRLLPGVCILASADKPEELFGCHPLSPIPPGGDVPSPEPAGVRGTMDQEGFLFLECSDIPALPADEPAD